MTTTPSVVAFKTTEEEVLIGAPALNQMARNPANTIYDAKRLLGKLTNDPQVIEDRKVWPFKIQDGGKLRP